MRAVVLGLGASGRAAAALLVREGWDVVGVDRRTALDPIPGVTLELGPTRPSTLLQADTIVVSPGYPPDDPHLRAAERAGVRVQSEIGLAAERLGRVPLVGITGTNGKSTVTHLVGQLLEPHFVTFVGGNLGTPLSEAVGRPFERLVVELSSYQLERPGPLRPRAAVILNLSPDHLARHGTLRAYGAAKAKIFANQGPDDLAMLPRGDALLTELCASAPGRRCWIGAHPGVVRRGVEARVALPDRSHTFSLEGLSLPGTHNQDNAAVALALALAMGAPADALQRAVPTLTGLPHRMMPIASDDGLRWIDDSKSTNIASTAAALAGRTEPTVLLVGGQAKRSDGVGFGTLVPYLGAVHTVIAFGADGDRIRRELAAAGAEVERVETLAEAVEVARCRARPGDTILLSPGCASFDAFDDFAHRGRAFARYVREGR